MPTVTLPEAKAHLNIGSGTTQDAELTLFIDRAEAALGKRVGPIGATAKTERVRGGTATLRLNVDPVISLTTVTSTDGIAVPVDQLTILSGGRVVHTQAGYFPARFYDVVYQAGWAAPLPADLALAVLELTRHLWDTQRAVSGRIGGGSQDSAANTLPGAERLFPYRIEQLIAPYLPVLGA